MDSWGIVVREVGGGAVKTVDIPNQTFVSMGGVGISEGGSSRWAMEEFLVEVKQELFDIKEKINSLLLRLDKVMGLGELVGHKSGMVGHWGWKMMTLELWAQVLIKGLVKRGNGLSRIQWAVTRGLNPMS